MTLYALQLYRALLRASRRLPSLHRQQHVARKARHEFEHNRHCADQEQVDFLLRLGELQLENCLEQAKHLSALQAAGHLRT